jgi:hypothetical protein
LSLPLVRGTRPADAVPIDAPLLRRLRLLGVGDPAVDLMVAWTYLSADARQVFRDELTVDGPTWARGRGWARDRGSDV